MQIGTMHEATMRDLAHDAVRRALAEGAQQSAASAYQVRDVAVQWRDGKLEKVTEATSRGIGVDLYVDGRYASVSTSDLRPDAVAAFLRNAVAMTRAIAADPLRTLPEPHLYAGQAAVDLELEDPRYDALSAIERRRLAERLEAAAREVPGAQHILSVTSSVSDNLAESYRVNSNGFEGARRGTAYWMGAEVSVQDPDGRRPEEAAYAGHRFFGSLPDPVALGQEAATRTLSRLGAQKGDTAVLTLAVDARAAGRLVSALMGPLGAAALQQKRSFYEGRLGERIGSDWLDITDDPLVPRGLASRLFDGEGMAAKRFPVFDRGVLKHFYVDTYYGKKLGMAPTTARMSNLAWRLGDRDPAALLAAIGEGVLVTGFLGGNSNATTGDFSLGVQGFRIRGGQVAEPLAEMNISGNHLELWHHLVATGNDPYAYSPLRTPTLVFEGVQFAGN